MLIRRKDEYAGKVIRIPRQFLLREISQDRIVIRVVWVGKDEDVEEEGHDVEENGFMIEEELCEQGNILRKQLIHLPIYLPDGIPAIVVDFGSWWCRSVFAYPRVFRVGFDVAGVPEAPATDVEAVAVAADEVFRVYGLVPGLELKVAEDDVLHGWAVGGLGVGREVGRGVLVRHWICPEFF